jgi:preprotein translocase subunit SecF
MRIIGDTNIPFLSYRKIALGLSSLLLLAGLAYIFLGPGLNLGIDFVGGTQVTVKFREAPDLQVIREALGALTEGTPEVQRFDEAEKHEVMIRVENPGGTEGDFTSNILDALGSTFSTDASGVFDLNTNGSKELMDLLIAADPDAVFGDPEAMDAHYRPQAEAVLSYRKLEGMFYSLDELDQIGALSDASREHVKGIAGVGEFALLAADSVGPSVGADLRGQAMWAIGASLLGMMAYIWFRFQLASGVGAVAALFHDVLITLSALAVTNREINLPTVAAILTLVGYSVNDTVVVFDRVRENLKLHRGDRLEKVMNQSINQTLSRTFITSGTTFAVVLTLYLFGGDVINTFAFVLLVGIIVGTYSSIFVASPVALYVNRLLVARKRRKRQQR